MCAKCYSLAVRGITTCSKKLRKESNEIEKRLKESILKKNVEGTEGHRFREVRAPASCQSCKSVVLL